MLVSHFAAYGNLRALSHSTSITIFFALFVKSIPDFPVSIKSVENILFKIKCFNIDMRAFECVFFF